MLKYKQPDQNRYWIEQFNHFGPVELINNKVITHHEQYHDHVARRINSAVYDNVDMMLRLNQAIEQLPPVPMLGCQHFQGEPLPVVQLPPSLIEEAAITKAQWLEALHNDVTIRDRISSLMWRLQSQPRGFGCDYDSRVGWYPIGEFSPRPIDLASLAHEITHCLINNQWSSLDHSYWQLILSEFNAMYNEFVIVLNLPLSKQIKQDFIRYQYRIDEMNFYFFRLEWGCHNMLASLHQAINIKRFRPQYLLLRETLWTATGYQFVYAMASVLRRQQLRIDQNQGESNDFAV